MQSSNTRTKKILSWAFIFVVLFSYTGYVLSGDKNLQIAYAQAIPQQFSNLEGSVFVEVSGTNSILQNVFNRLRRVGIIHEALLCQISVQDFESLSKKYAFSLNTQEVNGETIVMAKSNNLSENGLRSELPRVKCENLKIFFETVFGGLVGHVS